MSSLERGLGSCEFVASVMGAGMLRGVARLPNIKVGGINVGKFFRHLPLDCHLPLTDGSTKRNLNRKDAPHVASED